MRGPDGGPAAVDADGLVAVKDDPAWLLAFHAECVSAAREAVDSCQDLDHVAAQPRHGHHVTLRWILLHMLDEVARHNGHADIIREAIDGAVGS